MVGYDKISFLKTFEIKKFFLVVTKKNFSLKSSILWAEMRDFFRG